MICTIGGTYKNSKGDAVPASPMLAPAPDSSNSDWNVTTLTTLVTTHPELKNKLDEMGGWNADIASPEGGPGRMLRLAKKHDRPVYHLEPPMDDDEWEDCFFYF